MENLTALLSCLRKNNVEKCLFLLLILVVLGIFAISLFWMQDHCLDYGGRYNDNTQQCEQ